METELLPFHAHSHDPAVTFLTRSMDYVNSTLTSVTSAGEGKRFLPWDNPWNLMSHSTSRQIVRSVAFYIFPAIFLLGVSTNVLNCIVFCRQGLKDRMTLCLMWLSVTDLCYVLCETASVALVFLSLTHPLLAKEYEVKRLSYLTGMTLALLSTSGCISVVIAVERCLVVVFPLKAQSLLSAKAMGVLLGAITVLLQLAFSLFPLTMRPATVRDPVTGQTQWVLAPTQGPHKHLIFLLFQHVVDGFLQFALPLLTSLTVLVCTVITVLRLRMALSWRAVSSRTRSSNNKTTSGSDNNPQAQQFTLTRMLVLISVVYIVCSTPGLILALWRRVDTEFGPGGRYSNTFYATHIIAYQVFAVTNSSLNFFVYCWRSSRYRAVLHELTCRAARDKQRQEISRTTETN